MFKNWSSTHIAGFTAITQTCTPMLADGLIAASVYSFFCLVSGFVLKRLAACAADPGVSCLSFRFGVIAVVIFNVFLSFGRVLWPS